MAWKHARSGGVFSGVFAGQLEGHFEPQAGGPAIDCGSWSSAFQGLRQGSEPNGGERDRLRLGAHRPNDQAGGDAHLGWRVAVRPDGPPDPVTARHRDGARRLPVPPVPRRPGPVPLTAAVRPGGEQTPQFLRAPPRTELTPLEVQLQHGSRDPRPTAATPARCRPEGLRHSPRNPAGPSRPAGWLSDPPERPGKLALDTL